MELSFIKCYRKGVISIENEQGVKTWELKDSVVVMSDGSKHCSGFSTNRIVLTKSFEEFNEYIMSVDISENWVKNVLHLIMSKYQVFIKRTNSKEVRNLKFLQGKGLNCPIYVDSFEQDNQTYLVMERIEGRSLAEAYRNRSLEEIEIIETNLIKEMEKLRNLDFPFKEHTYVDRAFGKLDVTSEETIFASISEKIPDTRLFKETLYDITPRNNKFVLSHGDLQFLNIMINDNLEIYFVDWRTLNYLPDYWDIFSLVRLRPFGSSQITELINHFKLDDVSLFCLFYYARFYFGR